MILNGLRSPSPDGDRNNQPKKSPSLNDLIASAEASGASAGYAVGKEAGEKIGRDLGAIERTAYIMELCREAGNLPCSKLIPELQALILGADPLGARQNSRQEVEEPEDLE